MELILTAKIKLLPNEEQKKQLIDTIKAIKLALNYTSKIAYYNNLVSSFNKLQKLVYNDLRKQFSLKSQMACNVCSVVASTYKSMKSNQENTLAIYKKSKFQYSYNRDYSFTKDGLVSIGTLNKRIKLAFITKGQEQYFDGSWNFGTATLIYKKGKFYLHIACKKEIEVNNNITNVIGIDLGMRFLATAIDSKSNHLFIRGNQVKQIRSKYIKLRKSLQAQGTKSAKRKLKTLSGRENRFMTNVNHCVSKALLNFAGENSLVVLEDLTNINLYASVQNKYRYLRMSWAFSQLKFFIEYKASMKNIKVITVDPKYTSQACPKCGFTHKNNRNYQTHTFTCCKCKYTSNDDRIGAINIRQKGIKYHNGITA
ncbi:MAG: transposase [Marinisporobacter sp.]|jgi:IS605 OrfB family transposase|nr:transposase [Marinisporobacter sp.]